MVEQECPQSGEFLATSGPAWTAMETTGHHVAVAGILAGNGGIHGEDSSMQIANPEKNLL
jgi:hypothetical protein